MNPVYLDLHIHTSDDPNSLNQNYDIDTLIRKVKEKAGGDNFLISLTDHNIINEKVYLDADSKIKGNLILGVELHIQTHKGVKAPAYHCHIYFDLENNGITKEVIEDINSKLDIMYPDKAPEKLDPNIPNIQDIIETFDQYDFILLPHGGQTHATFDTAMPKGKEFDNAMERSIYYNFFDGFTSRSDEKTEKTKEYLERLGVHDFVNLVTCTDNYDPSAYPSPKNEETYKFIPTWMYATPSFGGLRLSLSDSSRLEHSHTKPKEWRKSIETIKLNNDFVDIDVTLTPGLNVIIGESSSGKTLLVDTLCRKIAQRSFIDSKYFGFGVQDIEITYPENLDPHFIEQNYIINVTRNDKRINDIGIIKKILPENIDARKKISKGLGDLNSQLTALFDAVEKIESLQDEIKRIPVLSSLITLDSVNENVLKDVLNVIIPINEMGYGHYDEENDLEYLDKLEEKLENNPFIKHNKKLIEELKIEMAEMRAYTILESNIKDIVEVYKDQIDTDLVEKEGESQQKTQDFELLIVKLKLYYRYLMDFDKVLQKIAAFSIASHSEKVLVEGYELSVENNFKLDKDIVKLELNNLLLRDNEIDLFENITPERLFKSKFKNNSKGSSKGSGMTYKSVIENMNERFVENDDIKYKIYTAGGKDFDNLSPGLKTAIVLELILNFEGDNAPLVIDQPEDNLATSYLNDGLVKSIKKMKNQKQIIFVSHSATIPMSGDAQNVILCENIGGKIVIRSASLEGRIRGIKVVDLVASITDGGKSSLKKRFKKYNLKNFK